MSDFSDYSANTQSLVEMAILLTVIILYFILIGLCLSALGGIIAGIYLASGRGRASVTV